MSLRALTILFIGLAFVSLTAVLLITQQVTLQRHFSAVEAQDSRSDLQRAQALLFLETGQIQAQCREWSGLLARSPEEGPPPAGLDGWFVLPEAAAAPVVGVADGQEGLNLTTRCPLDNTSQLVAVRRLDSGLLQPVEALLQAEVHAYSLADDLRGNAARVVEPLLAGEVVEPVPLDELSNAAYTLLKDPDGQPAALLEVISPRRYYRSSMLTRNYLAVATVLSAIIFAATTFYVLEGLVLGRARRLSTEVSRIGEQGDPSARVTVTLKDELTTLAHNINRMLASLEQAQLRRTELLEEVQNAQRSLQSLSHQLVTVQEEERRRIALELHDEVGQSLTGIKLLLEGSHNLPAEQMQARLQRCQNLANELIVRVRQMSLELRPPMLDDLGLVPALMWLIDRYSQQSGIAVRFHHPGLMDQRFPADVEIAAYRVVQEGLTNTARYAGVDTVDLIVWEADGRLEIQLEDQGKGFDPIAALSSGESTGLTGMRERVQMLDGDFILDTAPGQGCCLSVSFSLDRTGTQEVAA